MSASKIGRISSPFRLKTVTFTRPSWDALKSSLSVSPRSGLKTLRLVTAGTSAVEVGSGVVVIVKVWVMLGETVKVGETVKLGLTVALMDGVAEAVAVAGGVAVLLKLTVGVAVGVGEAVSDCVEVGV